MRNPADGSLRQRDVRQLSGGERRRVALALCLGFSELVRRRRKLLCNVIVLDEVCCPVCAVTCPLFLLCRTAATAAIASLPSTVTTDDGGAVLCHMQRNVVWGHET